LKTTAYGVEIDRITEIKLMKYISDKGIAMNTLTEEQRKNIVTDFINKHQNDSRSDQSIAAS
jgi:hypothetical protein